LALEFLTGLGTGALLTEAAKAFGKHVIEGHFDKQAGQRKLIREDAVQLLAAAESLLDLALKYYEKTSADGADEARQVRAGFKTFGVRWNTIDKRLGEIGLDKLESQNLIRFRQSLTSELDVERHAPLAFHSSTVASLFSAFAGVSEEMSALKYRAV
jgi:hypothetical protein